MCVCVRCVKSADDQVDISVLTKPKNCADAIGVFGLGGRQESSAARERDRYRGISCLDWFFGSQLRTKYHNTTQTLRSDTRVRSRLGSLICG